MKKTILFISLCSITISSTNLLSMHCCKKPKKKAPLIRVEAVKDNRGNILVEPFVIEKAKKQECKCNTLAIIGGSLLGAFTFATVITFAVLRVVTSQ